jgi:hypothetical protein
VTQPGDAVTLGIRENPGHVSISFVKAGLPDSSKRIETEYRSILAKSAPPGWAILAPGYALAPSVQPRRILIVINAVCLTLIVARQTFTLERWFKYVALLTICIGSVNGLFRAHGIKGATYDCRCRSPGA